MDYIQKNLISGKDTSISEGMKSTYIGETEKKDMVQCQNQSLYGLRAGYFCENDSNLTSPVDEKIPKRSRVRAVKRSIDLISFACSTSFPDSCLLL